jgi:hypothetical protein
MDKASCLGARYSRDLPSGPVPLGSCTGSQHVQGINDFKIMT